MNDIELTDITKTFGKHVAVDRLSLSVPKGCVYGFIGPNGSGKTTTLRMILNIIRPDHGEISIFGQTLNDASCDRIGYMPEERGLYKRMKVRELLLFFGGLKRRGNLKPAVDKWLERLDMTAWADKKLETLSKGMAQKIQFISTVVSDPELVILDEPFTGLDPVNSEVIKDAILEMQSNGTTIIFSTHDMAMAERMCDFIFMIYNGQKVLDGTLTSIQDQYASDIIRLRAGNGSYSLKDIAGIEKINDYGQTQEIRLQQNADTQQILKAIMARTTLYSFEVVKPSLYDIFVRIASKESQEAKNA